MLREQLQAQQPGARLILLDLPGTGVLHQQPSPMQVPAIVEACRDELAARGVDGPVHLLAMSLGAMVVSDWVARYPREVSGAVLINTSLRPFVAFYRRYLRPSYLALLLLSLNRRAARRREARVLSLTTRLLPRDDESTLDQWVSLQREHPVGLRNTLRQAVAAISYRASRGRPATPMLLLCSKADQVVDWRCSRAISRAWGAPLRLHTKAGHDLPLDDGPWVARAVGEWLQMRQMQGVLR
ncbi:alpha/beta fold hydrolase [Pelomonas sp. KK5]|uniref:alpha/beta fold hydrolase n=1 Tax=Pelomonas sp. KK5 TaxID=1855730 RepID=UPI001E31DB34